VRNNPFAPLKPTGIKGKVVHPPTTSPSPSLFTPLKLTKIKDKVIYSLKSSSPPSSLGSKHFGEFYF